MKDPTLKFESWDRFLPVFKKKNVQTKKPKKQVTKKKYTPFPPPQQPSKMDLQLESGEYFLKEHEKKEKKHNEKEQAQLEKFAQKNKEKALSFVAPKEDNVVAESKTDSLNSAYVDVEALKKKLKNKKFVMPATPKVSEIVPDSESEANVPLKKKKKKRKLSSDKLDNAQADVPASPKIKKRKQQLITPNVISSESVLVPSPKKKKKQTVVDEASEPASVTKTKKKHKTDVDSIELQTSSIQNGNDSADIALKLVKKKRKSKGNLDSD